MIVQRNTLPVKPGKEDALVEMLKEAHAMMGSSNEWRIYTSYVGPFEVVVMDIEFENIAEFEAFWEKWWSLPETPAFMEKFNALESGGGSSALWNVVE